MYYSDGRKKGDRKEVTELTLEKAFKIENVEVNKYLKFTVLIKIYFILD